MNHALNRFRLVAFVEGISYLILLFIAMPLKYWFSMPAAVRVVGMAHGILFVLFCMSLLEVLLRYRWSLLRTTLVFVSSLIPFGTFVVEYKWLRNDASQQGRTPAT